MNSITKVPREARWSVFYLLAALAVLAALVAAPQAHAFQGYLNTFNNLYNTAGTPLDNCGVCHQDFLTSGNPAGGRNPYGQAFGDQPGTGVTDFQNIEALFSDGDATNNIGEINLRFFPGWDCNSYTSATGAPPANLANLVDPDNIGCGANQAPVAADDTAQTNQDTAVVISVLDNDNDVNGDLDPASVVVTNQPGNNGSAVANPDGTITYTPAAGFFSPPDDTFTYTVSDLANNTSNPATVTVTVNQVIPNQPPQANDDTAQTNQDTAVVISVLDNDNDVNGDLDPASVVVTNQPGNGSAVANPDGTITYTPAAGFFSGPDDTFTYTVSDLANNTSNPATVTVTVNEVIPNQPPQASDDTAETNQDTAVVIPVLDNDNDVNGDLDPANVVVTNQPGNGSAVANPDGTITYTPAAGFFSPPDDTFTYTVDDLAGNTSNEATVTVTVNEAVVADCANDLNITRSEYRANQDRLTVNGDGGERNGGPFELSNAFDSTQILGVGSQSRDRRFSFNIRNISNPGPVPCSVRVEQIETGRCAIAEVDNAPEDCAPPGPVVPPDGRALTARGDTYATPVGNTIEVTASRLSGVLYNDFGGVPPLSASLVTGPTKGTLVAFNPDGSFTYDPGTPGNPLTTMVDNSVTTFTYMVTDANDDTAEATVVLQTLSKQVDFKITMNYELGMHCTGFEFAYCCVLPPYNSIVAQVIKPAQGDAAANEGDDFVDGFPRLLEGDPNAGRDGLNRETVVRDWDADANQFQKYQLRYYHDAQPRQEGNTSKPNTSTLISAVEGNSLQYFNTVFDSAAPDPNTNALVFGPKNGAENVLLGDGSFGGPTDNYANGWLNHFYIYVDPLTGGPNLEGHGNTGLEADKIRLGVAGQVAYPPDCGAGLQPMGPVTTNGLPMLDELGNVINPPVPNDCGGNSNGNVLTFSANTGTVVYTQAKVLEDLPIMLTSPRIWEALGLPLTTFEDSINFFADPGAVDEDALRPFVAMKASLHEFPSGNAVTGSNGQPVIGFGTAPIDIPNCERCHSAPSVDPDTGLPNVNSPNWNRDADPEANNPASYPHTTGTVPSGTGLEDITNLEINFWQAYYDIVPGVDSTWYTRLKGAAINMLTLHDFDVGTSFTANYAGTECVDPNNCEGGPLTNESDIPQNTRLGAESVICQRCHADNVIANVKSATFDAGGQFPIPPISEAIHNQHRNVSEGGVIVFNDSLGRDGGCQGCHPAHRSDGVMDGYPITLGGDNYNADGDNRLNQGGCFVGRDVHSNPMKDIDGAETQTHLNAVGEWLSVNVYNNQAGLAGSDADNRGIWCTNCHTQLGQELWRTEDCNDLIHGDCLVNPRGEPTLAAVAAAVGLTEQEAIDFLDPKVDGFDRTSDQTHAVWNPEIPDAGVATIEVGPNGPVDVGQEGDFTVNILSFCTTDDCVELINANKGDESEWRYPESGAVDGTVGFTDTANTGVAVPFSAATDGRDHWLSAGEPHCADCHAAPYVEQSGNITAFPPFNYPAKASLMRYTRGHQDVSCQGCHESIHGLYPVTPAIDNTSYAQAAALNNDGSHGPIKCEACHTHVDGDGIPTWVDNLRYNDPTTPGNDNQRVAGDFDTAVGWMHTYTAEADPLQDVCRNCHGNFANRIADDEEEWLEHAMVNRVSRIAMDNAEINQLGSVSGATDPLNTVCEGCHGDESDELEEDGCNVDDGEWIRHLIEGRVAESVWEEVSLELTGTTCGW